MTLACAVLMMIVSVPVWLAVETVLFRATAKGVGGVRLGWGAALLTVVVAAIVQAVAIGVLAFVGLDGGELCGTLVGFVVWSATTAALTELRFGQAVAVGLVMALVWWVLRTITMLVLVATGAAALLGLAGLVFF